MPRKILIIEDETEMAQIIKSRLEKEGFIATAVENVKDAKNEITSSRPDLILSDIILPDGSGLELCKDLKSRDEFKNIPVIMITAVYTEDKDAEVGKKLGADAYLYKPYEMKELLDTVKKFITS